MSWPRTKYRNVPTVVYGVRFASKKEASRFAELKLLEQAREISELETQPAYEITISGTRVCKVLGDFRYREDGKIIVEDVKGMDNATSKLKRKLVKAAYPDIEWRVLS